MKIEKIDTNSEHLNILDEKIIEFIYTFSNGIRAYDKTLNVVRDSINLARIKTTIDCVEIELSARSMDNEELKKLKEETKVLLNNFNFEVTTNGKYPSWKPDINDFTTIVHTIYKKHNEKASLEAIHAGLECAIFKDKFPNIKVASIGPTINFPHSKKEQVSIKSVENVFKVVEEITKQYI